MRSKELHYFDHPRFGVIALITPYQPEPDGRSRSPSKQTSPPPRSHKKNRAEARCGRKLTSPPERCLASRASLIAEDRGLKTSDS